MHPLLMPAQCSCTYVCRHPVCNGAYQAEFYEVIGISCTVPEFTYILGTFFTNG